MTPQELSARLAAPFDPREVKLKPKKLTADKKRALVVSYVDARAVQERLDRVLGVENWQDEYQVLTDGSVMCQLRVRIGGEWLTKADVGSQSDQDDAGDRVKAAFSDALKRAAVKFGVGRYLYQAEAMWMDYDPEKKQIVRPRQQQNGQPQQNGHAKGQNVQQEKTLPTTGAELYRRLSAHDAELVAKRKCRKGELINHVAAAGVRAGYSTNINEWTGPAIAFAAEVVRAFEQAA